MRPLGYQPPKSQMLQAEIHGVDILPAKRRDPDSQQRGLQVMGSQSLIKA